MNMHFNDETFFVYVFPFLFVGIWTFVSFLLSRLSGWSELAKRFEHKGSFSGKSFRTQYGSMRGIKMNGTLTIGVNSSGLFLSQFFIFKLFHKPLFIPWVHITIEKRKGIFRDSYRMSFSLCDGTYLDISERLFLKLVPGIKALERAKAKLKKGTAN